MAPMPQANNAGWVHDLLLPAASHLAIHSGWSKKMLARWLGCWLKGAVPPDLLRWLSLNDPNRILAEKTLAEYIGTSAGHTIHSRRIGKEKKITRNTNWAKTVERSSGLYPTAYYNAVRLSVPDRFLYGALNWLVRRWYNEIRQYREQLPDAETRLKRLVDLLHFPILADSAPVPFQIRHLVRLYELHAFDLVDCLQKLSRREDAPFSNSDEASLRSIFARYTLKKSDEEQNINYNNLMELLVLLKSAYTLTSIPGWRLTKAEVDDPQNSCAPPKPVLYLENDRFRCQIRKGNIQNLDHLSKAYRSENASGFEPDAVFVFSKKTAHRPGGNAVIFLGDAKNYNVSSHAPAVREKLLNVFAFARALGIQIRSDADSMIKFHHLSSGEPVPSFLLFFPPIGEEGTNNKGRRAYRNVMEKFSISCFDCGGGAKDDIFCTDCPGNLKRTFQNIISLIGEDSFRWPLLLKPDNSLTELRMRERRAAQ